VTTLWLDLETYSDVPITHGVHAYAERAEILLFAWAIDDDPVNVWDHTLSSKWPQELYRALLAPDVLLYAHNSHFDRTVLNHALPEFDLPLQAWRDTMAQALAHSLPGGLGALCDVLGVPVDKAKDKAGRSLIQLFCKPRPATSKLRRATRTTHPVALRRDGAWLRIALPSGRCLCYPSPRVDDAGKLSYMGTNQYCRKWSRLKTYGGKLAENITQAAARDVLAASLPAIEAAGYQIVLTVHDEVITEAPDSPEFNPGHLAALMATNPPWTNGLPLAAAGFEAYRYRKE